MRTPLQPNEKVLLVTYTSWVMLVVPFLMVLAAIVIAVFIPFSYWTAVLILPALAYFGWKYLEWKHNIWVVTNFRVIDEFGVININTRESPLDKINNVSYSQHIWGRILGFGKVEIQTAATIGETIYDSVDKPKLLKDTITLAQADFKNQQMGFQMKAVVEQMQHQQAFQPNAPSATYVAPVSAGVNRQVATELEKLFELKQKGILSLEEYERAKNKLIG